jgi:polyphosphate kinase 2 (PPK2 family)
LEKQRRRIQDLQERLYAENERGMLIVLRAMDTGGKDGTIKHVFGGVNPQGCRVSSFKGPSAEEANHDFLWRYHKSAPARGRIFIFNRSHYEDVLVARVKSISSFCTSPKTSRKSVSSHASTTRTNAGSSPRTT